METRLPLEPVLWAKTAPPATPTPPLDGDAEADVAIVGAGYCGLSAALHLAQAGRSVIVLEAEEPGFGGSGRNNGHCVPDWTWHEPGEIDARFGARGDRVNNLQGDAADLVFSLIRDHQIECEAVQSGTLTVVRQQKNVPALRAKHDHWARLGKAVRWIERADMGDYVGSDAFAAAILFEDGGHLNAMAYCRGLAAAAMKAGARVHGKSPATALERHGGRWRVTTPRGRVTANSVLLATNAHRHGLWPGLDDAYYIVRSVGVATEPLPEEVRRAVLPRDNNVQELHHPRYFYFFFDGAGRLLTGGGAGLGVDQSAAQVGALVPLVFRAVQVPALDVVQRGRSERDRPLGDVLSAPDRVDVAGVVDPNRGRDRAVLEDPLADGEHLAGAGRHEHDVDQLLADDRADDVAVLPERAEPGLAGMRLGRFSGRSDPERHVGVLGVGAREGCEQAVQDQRTVRSRVHEAQVGQAMERVLEAEAVLGLGLRRAQARRQQVPGDRLAGGEAGRP